jgi:crotonyl-CoA reductase
MTDLIDAVVSGAPGAVLAGCELPASYRAAYLRKSDVTMFGDAADKDVRKSIHIGEVPRPELAPDEVLIAVMSAGINYNTVWSAMFEPVPTFSFLARYARQGGWAARHDLPYHVLGSDASGVVVRLGAGVRRWSVGDRVVLSPAYIDAEDPAADDAITTDEPLAWGFETNFGSLADFAVAKASQLLPKPPHLTWEEAACTTLCAATSYRMLVSQRGAAMKQGDVVLIWGAAGGLGGYAVQLVRNGGGLAVGVVSSPAKEQLARELGCAAVINRETLADGGGLSDIKGWRRLGEEIRRQVGEDPHIVFEHSGRETFGASVYVARRGGTIVTCGSSTGYAHEYDNRHLWMKVKRIIGSHGANYRESWEINRLVTLGMVVPVLSRVYPLDQAGQATRAVQQGQHAGKTSLLCLAPAGGLGVDDQAARDRIGERRLRLFRDS